MNRESSDADLHDKVISEIKKVLNQDNFDIYTNPGQEKNAGISDNYPDIIMTRKGTTDVRFILEVETATSINLDEAINQWKKYSNEINATFYLVVPEESSKRAQELVRQVGINVRFATYSIDVNNNLNFKFN